MNTYCTPRGRVERLPLWLRPFGRLLRDVILSYRRGGWRACLSDLRWYIDQHQRRACMKRLSSQQVLRLRQELMEGGEKNRPECQITITFGSRQFGNRDNCLLNFLDSAVRTIENSKRVEILLKIDEDDDLLFFRHVQRMYQSKLILRFLVSERGRGYADMHKYHAALLKLRSPTSRMLYILTEDAVFTVPNWDSQLLEVASQMENDFFIATPATLEETISLMGPNPVEPEPVYWVRGDDFPIISMRLLRSTENVANRYPGWTCLGNTFNVDGFSGDILRRLWELHRVNIHIRVPLFAQRTGVYNWAASPKRNHLRTETLLEFLREPNQKIRDEMVMAIVTAMANPVSHSERN